MLFFFTTVVAWRRFILASTLGIAVLVAAVSFVLPRWYAASTSIFPPDQSSGAPIYAELLQNLSLPLLGSVGSGAAPETIYIDMMKSRRVGEQLVNEFHLMDVYHAKLMEFALGALYAHVGFTLLENGLISVRFEDRDPARAAAVANRMIELLDELNRELNTGRAARARQFIEGQMRSREADLAAAETELRRFQESTKALQLEEQLRTAMEIVGSLTSDAIALESELEIMGNYASKSSEEYERKQREFKEVTRQLQRLKVGGAGSDADMVLSFIPTLEEVPELALQSLRRERDVEIQTTVYTMLLKEYEKARIEEQRDTPTLQVLDAASVPNLRSRPRRKLLVVAGGLVGLAWSTLFAVFATVWRENRDRSRVLRDVIAPVVADLSRLFRRKQA